MLLGMAADASFKTGRVELGVGDILLAYSDGVIESRDNADQEFGDERLEADSAHTDRLCRSCPLFHPGGASRISLPLTR